MKRIGEVVESLNVSADTLRYYEKIKLMPKVHRNSAGVRYYNKKDMSQIQFIKRSQKMGFSLEDIASLLKFRKDPQKSRPKVRELAHLKLAAIEEHLVELNTLRNELRLLTNLCGASGEGCPILEKFEEDK